MILLRRLLAALCLSGALLAAAAPAPAAAQDEWRQWPLPIPPGGRFQTAGGFPGDLSFFAPNRGLMTVGGNNSVPEGLWSWDGVQWHQLATVCGGGLDARIAWAGPDEFWTIARPSQPRDQSTGRALCHFKGGEVVGSYSSVPDAAGSYAPMYAAACNGPSDCWFAGNVGFHLRWDGASVQIVRAPQGRGVSDLLADGDRLFESTYLASDRVGSVVTRGDPEDEPRLLHRIVGGAIRNDAFVPAAFRNGTELRALDSAAGSDGRTRRWAVGGGGSVEGAITRRPPLAARLNPLDVWEEVTLTGATLTDTQTFGDVAAIPGSDAAWVTVNDALDDGQPTVARIDAGGSVEIVDLPRQPGEIRGAATRIDCPAINDCWVATARGYLYRLTSAAPPAYARDTDPAFQGTITRRPNEAAEQSVPDDPPQDDSLLLAPPIELASEPAAEEVEAEPCELPRLISRQRTKVLGKKRLRLVVSFRLARQARIGITARRGGKVVARAKPRTLRRGTRSLTIRVTRKRYPRQLSFVIRDDSGAEACAAASSTARTTGR